MLKVLAFRKLQKESQQQKIKAKMDSITDRNRLFYSDVENTALKKIQKIQDVSAEAEELYVKIVLVRHVHETE